MDRATAIKILKEEIANLQEDLSEVIVMDDGDARLAGDVAEWLAQTRMSLLDVQEWLEGKADGR